MAYTNLLLLSGSALTLLFIVTLMRFNNSGKEVRSRATRALPYKSLNAERVN